MDLGVDRYGRPTSMTQTSPYTQRRANNPANQQPDYANQQPEMQTQGGPYNDPRWTNGTWGTQPQQASSAPAPQPNQNWNTDGYAAPGYTATNFGNVLPGYDPTKWADPNHQTPKYVVGRILQETGAPSIQNLQAAMARIQQAYPGATFNGKDKINIPGVGEIDVLVNSSSGQNMQWAWQTGDAGGGMPMMPNGVPAPAPTVGPGSALSAAVSAVGRLPTYQAYQFQQRNIPVYQPGNITQFQAPDLSQFEQGQDSLIQRMLANPESMGADVVNMMRARQSEDMARMLQDATARMQQNAVSRGAIGGLAGGERRLNEAALSDLLGRFRDIDIEAAKTNFADRMNVLGVTDDALNARLGRATAGYGATLQGELAREEAQRAAIQSALQKEQFDFQRELAQADENRFQFGSEADQIRFDLQKALGEHGMAATDRSLGLEGARLAEMIRQFDLGRNDRRYEFDAGMGLNYNQLAANQQAQLINALLR